MTPHQQLLFQAEMMRIRKNGTTGMLLALFLGGIGVHRFYLKDGVGVLYLMFFWTFIPALVSLLEALMMNGRVENYNKQQAYLAAVRVKAMTQPAVVR